LRTPLLAILIATIAVLAGLASPVMGQSTSLVQQRISAACQFLETLYNPVLGFVRNTPNSSVYYVASDNLLAWHALQDCNNQTAKSTSSNITRSIGLCCSIGDDLMHTALFQEVIPLPFHISNILTIANSSIGKLFSSVTPSKAGGNYTVLWEVHNATNVFPDCTYGDVTVYTALTHHWNSDITGAQHEMDCLSLMYDRHGIVDEAYKDGSVSEHGIYQTYKLALYIYALQKISNVYDYTALDNLLRMQGPDGGFHTGYDTAGTHAATLENTETTSISIIALNATLAPGPWTILPLPSWLIYVLIGYAGAATTVVALVLVIEKRRPSVQNQHIPHIVPRNKPNRSIRL
jgi:hypothetical protein